MKKKAKKIQPFNLPQMSAARFAELLKKTDACIDAVQFCKGKSLAKAWAACERGDWMLWILCKMQNEKGWADTRLIVRLAAMCARRALIHIPKGEDRPRLAVEATIAWCDDPSEKNRQAANSAAYAAYAANSYASAYAAISAAYASAYAANAAANASVVASANAAVERKAQADMIREYITCVAKKASK